MSGLHALHKILIEHAHPRPSTVKPGEFLEIEPDVFALQIGPTVEEAAKVEEELASLGVKKLPLADKMFAFLDHASPAPSGAFAAGQKKWRDFFRLHGVHMKDGGAGISHLVMTESGIVGPGSVVALRDSHTPTMGAVGAFAASLAGGRLSLLAIGRYWLDVPKVVLINIEGELRKGVSGRDVSLYIQGKLGQRGALGKAVEFGGSFVRNLCMDYRFTLCNMGTELGAMASYIQPDQTTIEWCKPRAKKPFKVFETDPDYHYDEIHEIDVSNLGPQIALPNNPTNVKPLTDLLGQRIDQAYVGSCASGRLEDIAVVASLMKGRQVHPDVRLIVTPASREVFTAAIKLGYIDILHEANATVTNAGCGPCPGMTGGLLAPGEVGISCNTRNFKDRMGAGAEVYLASPATVAASAIEGCIASPNNYFQH